jgi:hypothetical protein
LSITGGNGGDGGNAADGGHAADGGRGAHIVVQAKAEEVQTHITDTFVIDLDFGFVIFSYCW